MNGAKIFHHNIGNDETEYKHTKGPITNEFTQVGGGGMFFCDTLYEAVG